MAPLARTGAAVALALAAGAMVASHASAGKVTCTLDVVSGNTYVVRTADDLRLLSTAPCDLGYNVRQTADIDLSGAGTFLPIGRSPEESAAPRTPFSGVYDGGGHAITGLRIVGLGLHKTALFGGTSGATIRNLSVSGSVESDGTGNGSGYAALLVGDARSTTIDDVHVSGSAINTGISQAAGLVGLVEGPGTTSILRSTSSARVAGGGQAGGLVSNGFHLTISDSYSTGVVSTSAPSGVLGGLVAHQVPPDGTLERSYFAGRLEPTGTVAAAGGIVGSTQANDAATDTPVAFPTTLWNSDSVTPVGQGRSVGTGATTAQMKDIATYRALGWNIVNGWEPRGSSVWGICRQVNDGYPFLQGHTSSAACLAPDAPITPAKLTATLVRSRTRVVSGATVRLSVRVANTGGKAAAGTRACITAPRGMSVVRARGAKRSGRTACFTVGTLAAGAKATRTMTVRASSSRRRTVTVTGTARASGIAKVAASPVRITILPARS